MGRGYECHAKEHRDIKGFPRSWTKWNRNNQTTQKYVQKDRDSACIIENRVSFLLLTWPRAQISWDALENDREKRIGANCRYASTDDEDSSSALTDDCLALSLGAHGDALSVALEHLRVHRGRRHINAAYSTKSNSSGGGETAIECLSSMPQDDVDTNGSPSTNMVHGTRTTTICQGGS